jgi:hypothetical protein
MKIAIVGSGVSGLTVAERLHRRHQVTLYEAEDRLGGHAYTLDLDLGADGTLAVDTGFMVFNDRNYPGFEGLLARLGIDRQRSDMSFSVADEAGRFEYTGASLNGLFATRRNLFSPRFYRMLGDVVRFQRAGRELVRSERDPSLGEWLEEQRFSPYFVERLIVPQLSAVWSADPAELGNFSARFLLTFFDRHGMLGLTGRPRWWTIPGGSRRLPTRSASASGSALRWSGSPGTSKESPSTIAGAAWSGTTPSSLPPTPTRRSRSLSSQRQLSRRCWERSPIWTTRSSCTPTGTSSHAAALRGRAGTSTSSRNQRIDRRLPTTSTGCNGCAVATKCWRP